MRREVRKEGRKEGRQASSGCGRGVWALSRASQSSADPHEVPELQKETGERCD